LFIPASYFSICIVSCTSACSKNCEICKRPENVEKYTYVICTEPDGHFTLFELSVLLFGISQFRCTATYTVSDLYPTTRLKLIICSRQFTYHKSKKEMRYFCDTNFVINHHCHSAVSYEISTIRYQQ